MEISIRPATENDARAVERLEHEFADYLKSIGDTNPAWLNAETYLKDGFGPDPAFRGLIAETQERVIGYLLYHPGYDVDRGGRIIQVIDLFVTESARGKGTGRALMEAAAGICRAMGGKGLLWSVFLKNELAMRFYENLGARYLDRMASMYWKVK